VSVGAGEGDPLLGHGIEIRSQPASGAEETHAIGAGCVESDEDDVGMDGIGFTGGE